MFISKKVHMQRYFCIYMKVTQSIFQTFTRLFSGHLYFSYEGLWQRAIFLLKFTLDNSVTILTFNCIIALQYCILLLRVEMLYYIACVHKIYLPFIYPYNSPIVITYTFNFQMRVIPVKKQHFSRNGNYNNRLLLNVVIFEELLPVHASVSECLWSKILENSSKLYKILAVMMHYKKMSVTKHFKKSLNLGNLQIKNSKLVTCEEVCFLL